MSDQKREPRRLWAVPVDHNHAIVYADRDAAVIAAKHNGQELVEYVELLQAEREELTRLRNWWHDLRDRWECDNLDELPSKIDAMIRDYNRLLHERRQEPSPFAALAERARLYTATDNVRAILMDLCEALDKERNDGR
jgi:hypothetical protein